VRTRTIVISVVVAMAVFVAGVGAVGWAAYSLTHDGTSSGSSPASVPAPAPSPSGPLPSAPPNLQSFYHQKLDWRDCAGGDQCAWLKAPLDYAHPTERTIRLAVLRVPAQDRSHRVGQLVVDPGGPGGSAIQYAASGSLAFGATIARYYDIVGMDPRGVGESTPLQCEDTKGRDAFLASDPSPDTPAEVTHLDGLIKQFGEACLAKDRGMTEHMSTVEAAKDMDVLRAALGEPKLDYHGASYGTLLGATYANLFPTHVGRMVLDGAIDPALSNLAFSLGQAHGFQTALDAFVADCLSSSCPLGQSKQAALDKIQQLLKQIDQKPLSTSSGRALTEGLATAGVAYPLYSKTLWPRLRDALSQAIDQGDGTQLLSLADAYNSRGPNSYTDNGTNALYAVNCLDHDDYVTSSQVPQYFSQFDKAAPTFSHWFAYGLSTCSTWPVKSGQHTTALHAEGAPPIVVIGTTRDPATPYPWAKALAKELDSGHLISRDGDGHTGFNMGNQCVDDAVNNYLVRGKVPRDGLSC
jgi:pimeloyl-ACP methyl ester carboxylesterase